MWMYNESFLFLPTSCLGRRVAVNWTHPGLNFKECFQEITIITRPATMHPLPIKVKFLPVNCSEESNSLTQLKNQHFNRLMYQGCWCRRWRCGDFKQGNVNGLPVLSQRNGLLILIGYCLYKAITNTCTHAYNSSCIRNSSSQMQFCLTHSQLIT